MDRSVLDRVLTIEETKQRMKDIRTAALHYGAVIHVGERGRDELVIVSSKTWMEATARSAASGAGSIPEDPYAVFSRALSEEWSGTEPEVHENRQRMRNLQENNDLSIQQMVKIAGPDAAPRRRRPS